MPSEITWGIAFRVWWGWMWRSILLVLVLSLPLGFVIGFVGAMLGMQAYIVPISMIFGFILGIGIQMYIVKRVLTKGVAGVRFQMVRK